MEQLVGVFALDAAQHDVGRLRLALLVLQHLQRAEGSVRRTHLLHQLETDRLMLGFLHLAKVWFF